MGRSGGAGGWRERVENGNDNEAREGKKSEDDLGYTKRLVACVRLMRMYIFIGF